MSAAKSSRINTPTEQNKEDNSLLIYRLEQVEGKVDKVILKMDSQVNIKKSDLVELKTAIFERFDAKNAVMEEDIKELKTGKAAQKDVDDIKSQIKGVIAFFTTVIGAIVVYYLTSGRP